ncbi:hypothetical protein DCC39_03070 [Pueribacillus theae]|uniref:Uncharacterized protein n=1 Tax=Pueribacillus theae TaxID=2171751 RepID=A0A2U1K7C6_9BACI|nr:hypothetical protein [Pueribacillus theae]PWA13124.1 hypothetical protein DCC39_03070 [Pueribacillus theae]
MSFALVFIFSFTFSTSASVFAGENFGVSTEPPPGEVITPFGLDPPKKSNVVNLTKEKLTFKGIANNSILYTNKNFKGKSAATYNITNYKSNKLTIKVYRNGGLHVAKQTIVISGNSTGGGGINNLDKNELYYLSFAPPSDFSGSVY